MSKAILDAANVWREFRGVGKAAGIGEHWTPRELRHSFVSLMSSSGVPVEEIARLAGHSSPRTTKVVYRRELRPILMTGAEAMDRLFNPVRPSRYGASERMTTQYLRPRTAEGVHDRSGWLPINNVRRPMRYTRRRNSSRAPAPLPEKAATTSRGPQHSASWGATPLAAPARDTAARPVRPGSKPGMAIASRCKAAKSWSSKGRSSHVTEPA